MLHQHIVEVKESMFGSALGIVDGDSVRARGENVRQRPLLQPLPGEDDGRRALAPEMGEMRLATARRTMQNERSRRPIGPPIDPADGLGIAVRSEEIRAAERGRLTEIEGQLCHAEGLSRQ